MSDYLTLSNYEMDLIHSGLRILLTENAKNSIGVTGKEPKQHYEILSLKLFELCAKIKSFNINKYTKFSFDELTLIKNGLLFLANFTYQRSLKEKDNAQYYDAYNLQLIKIRSKINKMADCKMC